MVMARQAKIKPAQPNELWSMEYGVWSMEYNFVTTDWLTG
ncbi:hypothetical protein SAMN05216420_11064 [Nitrosospira sp. Nl5]|nr:hypothetical protein SAMN05216420_11064 [Nitrosospira sp. Nl5]